MKESNIVFYSLNSISLVITSFILFISFRKNILRMFINQFMIYILISEVLNMLVKYFSFTRNSCFNLDLITNECRTPDFFANIQLNIEIFTEILTITAALVIALKINDSFCSQQIFKLKWVQTVSHIGIIAFSIVVSLSIGLYQHFHYQKKYSDRTIHTGKCLVLNCHTANNLVKTQVIIISLLILSLFIISMINYLFLKHQSKRLSFDIDVLFNQTQASIEIKKTLKRIMVLPISTFVIYIALYLDRLIKVIIGPSSQDIREGTSYTVLGYCFGITNGLKGALFSSIIVFIVSDIKESLFEFFRQSNKTNDIEHNESLSKTLNE